MRILHECVKFSSGLSSKRIILSPFTKEFRGEGHSYESLNFSEVLFFRAVFQNVVKLVDSVVTFNDKFISLRCPNHSCIILDNPICIIKHGNEHIKHYQISDHHIHRQ